MTSSTRYRSSGWATGSEHGSRQWPSEYGSVRAATNPPDRLRCSKENERLKKTVPDTI